MKVIKAPANLRGRDLGNYLDGYRQGQADSIPNELRNVGAFLKSRVDECVEEAIAEYLVELTIYEWEQQA